MRLADTIGTIDLADAVEVLARALDAIGKLAKKADMNTAADVVMVIARIYETVIKTAEKQISPEDAHTELAKLEKMIAESDTEADGAVDKKFD